MSAGKRRRKEPIQSPSDSEEGGDSIYDLNWEPEEGSVFKVPLHEFYNRKSEIPERFKGAHDWTTECLVGSKLLGTKRSSNSSEGLLYGIKFDDGNATAWYPRIYEWEDYCSGPDMTGPAMVMSQNLLTAQGSSIADREGPRAIRTRKVMTAMVIRSSRPAMKMTALRVKMKTRWAKNPRNAMRIPYLTRCLPRSNGRTPVWSVLTPD